MSKSKDTFGRIWSLKLDNVPVGIKLNTITLELVKYSRSIIAIFRQADYSRFSLHPTIFIQLTNEMEHLRLQKTSCLLIEGHVATIESVDVVFSSIPHKGNVRTMNSVQRNAAPLSLQFHGIDNKATEREFVYILRDLLITFEARLTLTGMRMIFDVKHKKLRAFGFAIFLSKGQAEFFHEAQVPYEDRYLSCHISERVPLLLSTTDLDTYLHHGDTWNDYYRQCNQLNVEMLCPNSAEPLISNVHPDPSVIAAITNAEPSPVIQQTVKMEPIIVNEPIVIREPVLSFNKDKPKRKPPKRRQPVETEERPLPKIIIHAVEILPPFKFDAPQAEASEEEVLDIGEAGLEGRTYEELMDELNEA